MVTPPTGTCDGDSAAAPGTSDIGAVPFLGGVEAALARLTDGLPDLAWLTTAMGVVASVVFFPLEVYVGALSFVAYVLVLPLEAIFHGIRQLPLGPSAVTDPLLVSTAVLTVALRVLLLPLMRRATRKSAEMQVLKPQLDTLRRLHRGDRQQLAEEMQKLQKRLRIDPLSGCLSFVPVIILVGGTWSLFHGLTTKAPDGVFAPEFAAPQSDLSRYLSSTGSLTTWSMNLTSTVFDVGLCTRTVPYLGLLLALACATAVSLGPMWRYRRPIAASVCAGTVLLAAFLPTLFVAVRVADALYLSGQSVHLRQYRARYLQRVSVRPGFADWDSAP